MVRTDTKRGWLRERYLRVPSQFATLLAALQAQFLTATEGSKAGQIISTSGNGQSTQWASGADATSLEDIAAAWSELMDIYDASNAALIASGIATPTDAQIYAEMMDRLQTVRSFTKDYTGLRCESGVLR